MLNKLYVRGLVLCLIFSLTCARVPNDGLVVLTDEAEPYYNYNVVEEDVTYGSDVPTDEARNNDNSGVVAEYVTNGPNVPTGEAVEKVPDGLFAAKYTVLVESHYFVCGGAIIGDRFVLTPAICIGANNNELIKPARIVAGANVDVGYNETQVIGIDIEKAYIPEGFPCDYLKNNIAVLKLKESFNFARDHDKVHLLNLPEPLSNDTSKYPTYEDKLLKFAGYGDNITEKDIDDGKLVKVGYGDGHLRVTNAFILNNEECERYYDYKRDDGCRKKYDRNYNDEICLGVNNQRRGSSNECKGDSGSTLVVIDNSVLIGLENRGTDCSYRPFQRRFTRVSSLIPFIKKAMRGDEDGLKVLE